jgi:short-subunit dehydrogenase
LKIRGAGQVAIMASVAGYRGLPKAASYGPTKAALINLAEILRTEFSGSGVDIRLVNPGFVSTRLTAKNDFSMPAIMTPEQAASRIIQGLEGTGFEIAFPRRFVAWLKIARVLPYRLWLPLARRMVG